MPQNTEQLLKHARELTEANRHEDARLCLLEILKDEPKNETALIMLGGAYFAMSKYTEAEMVFERLVIMEPGRGQFYIAMFNTRRKIPWFAGITRGELRFDRACGVVCRGSSLSQLLDVTLKFAKKRCCFGSQDLHSKAYTI